MAWQVVQGRKRVIVINNIFEEIGTDVSDVYMKRFYNELILIFPKLFFHDRGSKHSGKVTLGVELM